MANDPTLEHALLEHLLSAPLSRSELVCRTGASDKRVRAALHELVVGTFVVRRPQDVGAADYELTTAGSGRLELIEDLHESPLKVMGKVFRAMVVQVIWPRRSAETVQPLPGTRAPNWGSLAWILLPLVIVIAIIVSHLVTSGASVVTVVLFLLLVGARIAWSFRGRRLRR